jgi:hypothetical protein
MSELHLQEQVCNYLRFSYPHVIFRSDYSSGLKLTMGQAVMHRRLQHGRAWPDLQIVESRHGFHGLFIELKREGVVVYKKDGTLRADEHLREQANMLERLRDKGYEADFAVGFDQCKKIIDNYLRD